MIIPAAPIPIHSLRETHQKVPVDRPVPRVQTMFFRPNRDVIAGRRPGHNGRGAAGQIVGKMSLEAFNHQR